MRNISLLKNSALALLCVGLFLTSLMAAGCSKPKKKDPKPEKKVVTEMNIQSSTETETPAPKGNEVESLPFESEDASDKASEEELPILGSGK